MTPSNGYVHHVGLHADRFCPILDEPPQVLRCLRETRCGTDAGRQNDSVPSDRRLSKGVAEPSCTEFPDGATPGYDGAREVLE